MFFRNYLEDINNLEKEIFCIIHNELGDILSMRKDHNKEDFD